MAAIAGFGGRVLINGTVLRANHWSVDWRVDEFDVTTFENNGWAAYTSGLQDADISIDAYWDPTDNPFTSPISLSPGSTVEVVIHYARLLADETWTFPTALVCTIHNEAGVRDTIRYTATLKASQVTGTGVTAPSVPEV